MRVQTARRASHTTLSIAVDSFAPNKASWVVDDEFHLQVVHSLLAYTFHLLQLSKYLLTTIESGDQ
jgi:hypothetical protein